MKWQDRVSYRDAAERTGIGDMIGFSISTVRASFSRSQHFLLNVRYHPLYILYFRGNSAENTE